jgi:ribosome-associated protein
MDIKKLQSTVIDALEDIKAQEIRVYDTTHLTSLFDRIAIASGTSNRQTKALAASVRDKVKEHGGSILSIEGEETGEWVLVDLGDMIVHIMQPAIRAYYRLEEIWGDKEVKLGAAKRTGTAAKRAVPSEGDETPKKTGRHLAASQTADDATPKKSAARKVPSKTAGKSAAKTPASRKAVGKTVKVATAKSAAPKKTAAKSSAKTAAKPAAKRAPVKAKTV